MNFITFKPVRDSLNVDVYLDKKRVGTIKQVIGGFAYFPKGQREGGSVFPELHQVKLSLLQ